MKPILALPQQSTERNRDFQRDSSHLEIFKIERTYHPVGIPITLTGNVGSLGVPLLETHG